MNYDAIVEADELLAGKPFTDPENTEREVGVMRQMLEHERERARAWRDGDADGEHIVREHDEEGHRHLIVVPDTRSLLDAEDVTAVGFFARPRDEVDHTILFDLEDAHRAHAALRRARALSYYDVELVKGAYGNLILFSTPDVPPEWHGDPVHRRATEVSPATTTRCASTRARSPGPPRLRQHRRRADEVLRLQDRSAVARPAALRSGALAFTTS